MWKKIVGAVAVVIVIGVAWFFTQGPGVAMLHKSDAVDVGAAPAQPEPGVTDRHGAPQNHVQPEPVDVAPAPQQPDPVVNAAPVPQPAPQPQDASSNRGMQFLLNQGKSQ